MDALPTTRELTADEKAEINLVLRELREHFSEWPEYDSEHELIEFAIYEGCSTAEHCRTVLAKAAPLALGKQLVEHAGYSWVMVQGDSRWHLALTHPEISEPIELATVARGTWNREEYDEEPDPVMIVNDSYETLANAVRRPGDAR